MALQIIKHAFFIIFGNLGQALRVSIGPFLILIVVAVGLISVAGLSMQSVMNPAGMAFDPNQVQTLNMAAILAMLVLILVALFVAAWVAVSWHRFILLEEFSGVLPAVSGRPIWPYVGRTILYSLLMILIGMLLSFVIGLVTVPFVSASNAIVVGTAIGLVVGAIMLFIWFRIALALPSVAIGKPISMGDAWRASSKMAGTIFGVAIVLVILSMVAHFVVLLISTSLPLPGLVLDIIVQWLSLMVGVSVLTTLYGHVIEGRDLIE